MKGAIAKVNSFGDTIVGKYGISKEFSFKKGTMFHIVGKRENGMVFIVEKNYGGRRYKIVAGDLREVEVEPTGIGTHFILKRKIGSKK